MPLVDLTPLQTGDLVPPFCLPDQDGKLREIHLYAGRITVLSFLPAQNETFLAQYLGAVAQRENEVSSGDFSLLSIMNAGQEQLRDIKARYNTSKLGLTQLYWSDEQRKVSGMFGIADTLKASGTAFVLSRNHQILACITSHDGADMLAQVIACVKQLPKPAQQVIDPSHAIHPPVLVVPEAISPALQQELLSYWQNGQKYQGGIGADGNEKVVLSGKRRMDADIHDTALLTRIDQTLSKRVFMELRKTAGVQITHRERYKIGAYDSEDKGFYNQHRDTGKHLGFRRYSMSLSLSSEYEGGLLQFPEYNFCAYRLPARYAAVFPSTLLHGVTPVTSGKRFVMVSFFYTDAEAATRTGNSNEGMKLLCDPRAYDVELSNTLYTNSPYEK